MIADDFSHEMALLVCEKNANILFTGCAHSGVSNMIKTVLKRSGLDRIDRVMGGFHLLNRSTQETESRERIQLLASELAAYPHTKFYTGHCTGETAFRRLKETMNKNIFEIKTGSRIRV
jgi:7,8-dihydropterin-6-yl-methyl-4-(beta-D-ribofuranosyl)aminobenzene 5'-phosphate synthase